MRYFDELPEGEDAEDYHKVEIPVVRYGHPLDPLQPDDLLAMERTLDALLALTGAVMAHEECAPGGCSIYNADVIENLLFCHAQISDIVAGLKAYRGVDDEDRAASIAMRPEAMAQLNEDVTAFVNRHASIAKAKAAGAQGIAGFLHRRTKKEDRRG